MMVPKHCPYALAWVLGCLHGNIVYAGRTGMRSGESVCWSSKKRWVWVYCRPNPKNHGDSHHQSLPVINRGFLENLPIYTCSSNSRDVATWPGFPAVNGTTSAMVSSTQLCWQFASDISCQQTLQYNHVPSNRSWWEIKSAVSAIDPAFEINKMLLECFAIKTLISHRARFMASWLNRF